MIFLIKIREVSKTRLRYKTYSFILFINKVLVNAQGRPQLRIWRPVQESSEIGILVVMMENRQFKSVAAFLLNKLCDSVNLAHNDQGE